MHEPNRARRILVVEDDPNISALIRLHLESAGFEVRVVYDGNSGLQGAVAGDVDLVILDVGLLGADDYLVKPFRFEELLARVRALLRRPPLAVKFEEAAAEHVFAMGGRYPPPPA